MTYALTRAVGSPAIAGVLSHALPRQNDSNNCAGKVAGRHFCEGSTK
jgi:hypothetical protein